MVLLLRSPFQFFYFFRRGISVECLIKASSCYHIAFKLKFWQAITNLRSVCADQILAYRYLHVKWCAAVTVPGCRHSTAKGIDNVPIRFRWQNFGARSALLSCSFAQSTAYILLLFDICKPCRAIMIHFWQQRGIIATLSRDHSIPAITPCLLCLQATCGLFQYLHKESSAFVFPQHEICCLHSICKVIDSVLPFSRSQKNSQT